MNKDPVDADYASRRQLHLGDFVAVAATVAARFSGVVADNTDSRPSLWPSELPSRPGANAAT